ncbi:MAG: response regulator [Elusimicrobiota bacterium]
MGFLDAIKDLVHPPSYILVVDDDEALLETTILALQQKGYKVLKANNGRDGLNLAILRRPVLVILDINMPELDGWEVLEGIRSSSVTKNTPVIMLTTINVMGQINRSFELGANGYLTKPLDIARLYRKVEELAGPSPK